MHSGVRIGRRDRGSLGSGWRARICASMDGSLWGWGAETCSCPWDLIASAKGIAEFRMTCSPRTLLPSERPRPSQMRKVLGEPLRS